MKENAKRNRDLRKNRPQPHPHSTEGQPAPEKHRKIAPKHPGRGRS